MDNKVLEVIDFLSKNKLCIFLEGLISSGKSTLGRSCKKHLGKNGIIYNYYAEPINEKLLDLFYSNIRRHAFNFQSITIRERVHVRKGAINFLRAGGNVVVIDRSEIGDCAFALMHHKDENISDEEFEVYADLTKFKSVPDVYSGTDVKKVIVYLDCTAEKARERVITRGNEKEILSCTVEYLSSLKHSYEKVFKSRACSNKLEETVINQIYDSIGTDDITYLDYNSDFNLVDGELSEEDIFAILYKIIERLKSK